MMSMMLPTEAEWLAAQAQITSAHAQIQTLKTIIATLYQRLDMADTARRRIQDATGTVFRALGAVLFPRERVMLADGRQVWALEESERQGVLRARDAALRVMAPAGVPVVQMRADDLAEQAMRAQVTSRPRGPMSRPLGAPIPPSRPLTGGPAPASRPLGGGPQSAPTTRSLKISAVDLRTFGMTLEDLADVLDGAVWPLTCPRCGETVHRLERKDLADLDTLDAARFEWRNQLDRHLRIRHTTPEPGRG